jgi:predicted lipid-binding transport protein (Tim44 family)
MAEEQEKTGNTAIIAVLVIFIVVAALGFFAWQKGRAPAGGGGKVNVEIQQKSEGPAAPAPSAPAAPAPQDTAPAENPPPAESPQH